MSIWHRLQQFLARGIFKRTHSSKNGALQLESLEARSLLASHPLVDAPDVDYVVTDQWSTVRNDRTVLPVRADARRQVPGIVHDASRSGSTAVSAATGHAPAAT